MHITVFFFNSFVTIVHVPTIYCCVSKDRVQGRSTFLTCLLYRLMHAVVHDTSLATIKLIISHAVAHYRPRLVDAIVHILL